MRAAAALLAVLVLGGCALTNPRPVYRAGLVNAGQQILVIGVEPLANRYSADVLARQLAFALTLRGRNAVPLSAFIDAEDAAGRPLPEELRLKLQAGVVSPDTAAWLQAAQVKAVIFLETEIYDQIWGPQGKRTRVAMMARGHDLLVGEDLWRAFVTPEVDDEPGRGFQIATDAAVAGLARAISGEGEPFMRVPKIPDQEIKIPAVQVRW